MPAPIHEPIIGFRPGGTPLAEPPIDDDHVDVVAHSGEALHRDGALGRFLDRPAMILERGDGAQHDQGIVLYEQYGRYLAFECLEMLNMYPNPGTRWARLNRTHNP